MLSSFKCKEHGKQFKNTNTNGWDSYVLTTCQANKTWSISSIPFQCECEYVSKSSPFPYSNNVSYPGSHCVSPPQTGAAFEASKLKVQYNAAAPPAHNETVLYVCDAGPTFNRFESDFGRWNYSLTCLENNVFSEEPDVPWPTCVDSKDPWSPAVFSLYFIPCSY